MAQALEKTRLFERREGHNPARDFAETDARAFALTPAGHGDAVVAGDEPRKPGEIALDPDSCMFWT
jgi:hypothetical protein